MRFKTRCERSCCIASCKKSQTRHPYPLFVTPAEIFLAGVGACGVELMQVIAKERGVPLKNARVAITGEMARSRPVRPDVTLFNTVKLRFDLSGVTPEQGAELVSLFKGR